MYRAFLILLFLFVCNISPAQTRSLLHSGWQCMPAGNLSRRMDELSMPGAKVPGGMPAVVPGTILTTLIANGKVPDPFYGMNNKQIPDVSVTGWENYSYYYICDFKETASVDEHVFLTFRGLNYYSQVYLNGYKLNDSVLSGMYLRHTFDITQQLSKHGNNRLAVYVAPPVPHGIPNGGQGGDGTIAHSVTNQYVAGWDWIQPIADRNTGIWDQVILEKVHKVRIEDAHIVPHVPGRRYADAGVQQSAYMEVSVSLHNPGRKPVAGTAYCTVAGIKDSVRAMLKPGEHNTVKFGVREVVNPRLWWPAGMGGQYLYPVHISYSADGVLCDSNTYNTGMRELTSRWNTHTQSRELYVNGQRMFVKGANWILSDALLRFSPQRYDAEVRYHRDMNLNMIRVWGGGITERPEFYEACDRYGLLVFQDFWMTGDCNGRWYDTYKKDDTTARRQYPDSHNLWLASAADQITMLRNHPSLAVWCGGNEIRPPADMLKVLKDSLLPALDRGRIFFEYSNHDSMSLHAHDGPYTIQPDTFFWQHRSWGFNSEVGSVGIGDIESLRRYIPEDNLVPPHYDEKKKAWVIDSVWKYHKYSSYDSSVEAYGHPSTAKEFAAQAQLVNYNQYRALMEGTRAHMWDWYTGVLEWKTQNPWTAMVGQMYDVYLDPNACMYGLKTGARPLHVMYHPVTGAVYMVNDAHIPHSVRLSYNIIGAGEATGEDVSTIISKDTVYHIPADTVVHITDIARYKVSGGFVSLVINDVKTATGDTNLYWMPDDNGSYRWLQNIAPQGIFMKVAARYADKNTVEISLDYNGAGVAFFNHITLVDRKTRKRLTPLFASDNYISLFMPCLTRKVQLQYVPQPDTDPVVCIDGWNTGKRYVEISK